MGDHGFRGRLAPIWGPKEPDFACFCLKRQVQTSSEAWICYKPTSSARPMRGMDLPATHDAWRRGAVAGSGARGEADHEGKRAYGGLFKALMEL